MRTRRRASSRARPTRRQALALLRISARNHDWLKRLLAAARPLRQIRGVTGASIDFKLNRLVVLGAARTVVPHVLDALPRIGIPQEAVTFRLAVSTGTGTSP